MASTSAAPPPTELPAPHQRPGADVVIFDGDCRSCTEQIARLARWDSAGRLAFLSLHDPAVARQYPDLTYEMMMREMYVIDRRGKRHGGAEALRYLSRRLPRLWWAAPVLHLPGSMLLWRWLYQQVAQRRYRFGRTHECADGACHLHIRS